MHTVLSPLQSSAIGARLALVEVPVERRDEWRDLLALFIDEVARGGGSNAVTRIVTALANWGQKNVQDHQSLLLLLHSARGIIELARQPELPVRAVTR